MKRICSLLVACVMCVGLAFTAVGCDSIISRYTVTYTNTEDSNGVITVYNDEVLVESGASFIKNTELTVLLMASSGYQLKTLYVNTTAFAVANNTFKFTLTQDVTITAEFEKAPTQLLSEAKIDAINDLESYVVEDDYSATNWLLIEDEIESGISAINSALNMTEVSRTLAEAKQAIDGIDTIEALLGAKKTATTQLENYVTQSNYSASNWLLVEAEIEAGLTEIDNATNTTAVASALSNAKLEIDKIATIQSLDGAKGAAMLELASYSDEDYSDDNWKLVAAEIAACVSAIGKATSLDAIANALENTQQAIDEILTLADEAELLTASKIFVFNTTGTTDYYTQTYRTDKTFTLQAEEPYSLSTVLASTNNGDSIVIKRDILKANPTSELKAYIITKAITITGSEMPKVQGVFKIQLDDQETDPATISGLEIEHIGWRREGNATGGSEANDERYGIHIMNGSAVITDNNIHLSNSVWTDSNRLKFPASAIQLSRYSDSDTILTYAIYDNNFGVYPSTASANGLSCVLSLDIDDYPDAAFSNPTITVTEFNAFFDVNTFDPTNDTFLAFNDMRIINASEDPIYWAYTAGIFSSEATATNYLGGTGYPDIAEGYEITMIYSTALEMNIWKIVPIAM